MILDSYRFILLARSDALVGFEHLWVQSSNTLRPNSLPLDNSFIHKEGESRSYFLKKLHERVRNQIENQTKVRATKGNRGRRELVLNEGD